MMMRTTLIHLSSRPRIPLPRLVPRLSQITRSSHQHKSASVQKNSQQNPVDHSQADTRRTSSWWENGNFLIYLGWSGLALLAVDRYLLYTQRQETTSVMDQLVHETEEKRRQLFQEWKDSKTLFRCKIHEEYKAMGGSHGLQGVRRDDVVEVLQEGVGPGGYYNLCRTRTKGGAIDSIGWYPISYMQKIRK